MNETVRVLHVLGTLNIGGAETMVMNLYRNIDTKKIQFDFVIHTDEECDYTEEVERLGGRIYTVPKYTGTNHFEYISEWKNIFLKYPEYKIVHGHVRSTASIYLKVAKKFGKITIAHSHSTSSGDGFSGLVKKILQIPIKNNADKFMACSAQAGTWLFGEKILSDQNFTIINNSIDAKSYCFDNKKRNKLRNRLKIENKIVIGHVGRFVTPKNHDFIIEIFNHIQSTRDDVVLLLVGNGELKKDVENKVRELGLLDKCIFAGKQKNAMDYLFAMDMFLFPSKYEGLGMAVIEAQAAGLKTFVSDRIPNEAIITNLVSVLSLDSTSLEWANIIGEIVGSYYERKDMVMEIEEANFDIKKNSFFLENYYFQLLTKTLTP